MYNKVVSRSTSLVKRLKGYWQVGFLFISVLYTTVFSSHPNQIQMDREDATVLELLQSLHKRFDDAEGVQNGMKSNVEGLHKKFDEFREDIKVIKHRLATVETAQDSLKSRVASLEKENLGHDKENRQTRKQLASTEMRLQEEIDRVKRSTNIILFGVPETEDGVSVAMYLLNTLIPHSATSYPMIRLGKPNESGNADTSPRPLKVSHSSFGERALALRNCRLLKDRDEFKGISVRPDETPEQRRNRATRNAKKNTANNESSGRKRVLDDPDMEIDCEPVTKRNHLSQTPIFSD